MGTAFSGRHVYAYVNGNAVVNLRGWNATVNNTPIDLPPDISSGGWTYSSEGFRSVSGSIEFNLTSDDFADLFDVAIGAAAVGMYLYTNSSVANPYLYGQAWLGDISISAMTDQAVSGTVNFKSTGTWARQVTT